MFLLFENNKIKPVFFKKEFFSTLIVYFYPAVPNINRNKHIKPIVNRPTVTGTY